VVFAETNKLVDKGAESSEAVQALVVTLTKGKLSAFWKEYKEKKGWAENIPSPYEM
jgi:hypothetical protein